MKLGPWAAALGLVWAIQFLMAGSLDPYLLGIMIYAGINVMLAVSLNLVNGFTGQFSMGHAGFMSVGGYVAAYATTSLQAAHPEWFAAPLVTSALFAGAIALGGGVAALVGYGVGLPCLRLKGDYLAIVTLGFGEIIRVIVLNIDAVGGARGLTGIPSLSSFGWVYTGVVLTCFAIWRLVGPGGTPQGRALLAVREDEIAAEAMGVDTTGAKVRAFVIGAFFAGCAGALFAHYLRYLNPRTFDFNKSFEIIIMVVLGGMGSISGSVLAAVLLTVLRELLRLLQEWTQIDLRMVFYSVILIGAMLLKPRGLFGTRELTDWIPAFKRKGAAAP